MGRGDDLLFNPPKIRKKNLKATIDLREFPSEIQDLTFLNRGRVMMRDYHGTLRIYSQDKDGELKMRSGRNLESGALLAGCGNRFVVSEKAFSDREAFVLTRLNEVEDISWDKPPLDKEQAPYGLALTDSYLYLLAKNILGHSTVWRTSNSGDDPWIEMSGYESEGLIEMRKVGNKSVLIFPEGGDKQALVTLGPEGLGSYFPLEQSGLEVDENTLIAPTGADGVYLVVQESDALGGSKTLTRFDLGQKTSTLLYQAKGKEILDLEQSGSKIFLLTEDDLALFSATEIKLLERLPVREDFDRLTSDGQGVILWKEGKRAYRRIDLNN